MKHAVLLLFVIGCHAKTRPPPRPPEERVAAAMVRWGDALRSGDDKALAEAEDRAGQFAIVYGGIKAVASHVDGGSKAVEDTLLGNLFLIGLQSLWPGLFGSPYQVWYAVVPTGKLGPALVAAGLASQPKPGDPAFAIVPVPWDDTIGRLERAMKEHRAKLREKAAWTCRMIAIEHTVQPTEPSLQRVAQTSTHIFGGWLRGIDAVWLVRAQCASGPALFAVTAYEDGSAHILLAAI